MRSKIIDFLTRDIWRLRLKNYSRKKSFFIKQLRVVVLAVRGYTEDQCKFRASALTFFSLLSFVPVLALMFGIAKGFGIEERVEAQIQLSLLLSLCLKKLTEELLRELASFFCSGR